MKAEKRKKKEEKEEEKKKKAGAKKTTSGKGASAKRVVRQPEPEPDDSSDEEGVDERLLVNDSSEYSDEETTWTEATYPFASNEAQVGDFVLVELTLEEGRTVGTKVCYVAHVLEVMQDGRLNLSFLRMKSAFTKDCFTFPAVQDETEVEPGCIRGVLVTSKSGTRRQADLIRVKPPLLPFNMYK